VKEVDFAHKRIAITSRNVSAVAGLLRVDERESELCMRALELPRKRGLLRAACEDFAARSLQLVLEAAQARRKGACARYAALRRAASGVGGLGGCGSRCGRGFV